MIYRKIPLLIIFVGLFLDTHSVICDMTEE